MQVIPAAPLAVAVVAPLLVIDVAYLASNLLKIPNGGWFPIVVGGAVFMLLTTWKQGRMILMDRLNEDSIPLDAFIASEYDKWSKVIDTAGIAKQ